MRARNIILNLVCVCLAVSGLWWTTVSYTHLLIERKIYAEVPPRVEDYLTDTGGTLIPHIEGLGGWALENMDTILEHRKSN